MELGPINSSELQRKESGYFAAVIRNRSLWTLFVLICGSSLYSGPVADREKIQRDYLENEFLFQNDNGIEAAVPLTPNSKSKSSPLGLLVSFPFGLILSLSNVCGATHVVKGEVYTASHCSETDSVAPSEVNYFFLYYNREGKKKAVKVDLKGSAIYTGKQGGNDVSVYRVSSDVAADWDSILETKADGTSIGSREESVKIWAFHTFHEYNHELKKLEDGARLAPVTCRASTELPVPLDVRWIEWDPTSEKVVRKSTFLEREKFSDVYQPFFDLKSIFLGHCSSPLVGGSSGSIVTDLTDPTRVLAILHTAVSYRDKDVMETLGIPNPDRKRFQYFAVYPNKAGEEERVELSSPKVFLYAIAANFMNIPPSKPSECH